MFHGQDWKDERSEMNGKVAELMAGAHVAVVMVLRRRAIGMSIRIRVRVADPIGVVMVGVRGHGFPGKMGRDHRGHEDHQ